MFLRLSSVKPRATTEYSNKLGVVICRHVNYSFIVGVCVCVFEKISKILKWVGVAAINQKLEAFIVYSSSFTFMYCIILVLWAIWIFICIDICHVLLSL